MLFSRLILLMIAMGGPMIPKMLGGMGGYYLAMMLPVVRDLGPLGGIAGAVVGYSMM